MLTRFLFFTVSALLLAAPYSFNYLFVEIQMSLSVVFLILTAFAWWHLFHSSWSLANSSIVVFFTMFFYIAPVAQLGWLANEGRSYLVNTMPLDVGLAVTSNLATALFLICYWFSFVLFTSKKSPKKTIAESAGGTRTQVAPGLLLVFVLLVFPATSKYLLQGWQNLFSLGPVASADVDGIATLFIAKVYAILPLVGFVISLKGSLGNKKRYLYLGLFLLLLLVFKNPIFERRNAIGAVYLTLIAASYVWLNNTNTRSMLFGFLVMAIMFPLASTVTNVDYSNGLPAFEDVGSSFTSHYTELHYDAWANSQAIVERAEIDGFGYGRQVSGVLLFFVPRSMWEGKPIGTGKEVGSYLIDNYGMWFDNLSAPYPFEGYSDFGLIGIVLFAIVLALTVTAIESRLIVSELHKLFYFFFSFSLYFILRGDLLASFAYTVGAFVGIVIIPIVLASSQRKFSELVIQRRTEMELTGLASQSSGAKVRKQ